MDASTFALLFFVGFLIGFLSRLFYARMTGRLRSEDFKSPGNVRYIDVKAKQDTEESEEEQERKAG